MGALRLYLAICVVLAHSGPLFPLAMLDGRQAVQLFFIISGFYMQFVLSTKYASRRQFYFSRALRIFVPYFAVLGVVLLVSVVSGSLTGDWLALRAYAENESRNGWLGVAVAALSNMTVFFQDWVMFLTQDAGEALHFTNDVWASSTPLWHYLVIPQSWSIGVELTFYLAAPFVAQRVRTTYLLLLIGVSLAARFFYYSWLGQANDPWTYRFFPFEFAHFGYGMLAARLYFFFSQEAKISWKAPKSLQFMTSHAATAYILLTLALLLVLTINAEGVQFFSALARARGSLGSELVVLGAYALWIPIIAVLFALSKSFNVDRWLGELSYPVYLIHYLVVMIVGVAVEKGLLSASVQGVVAVIASVGLSIVLVYGGIAPFERWRQAKVTALLDRSRAPDEVAIANAS